MKAKPQSVTPVTPVTAPLVRARMRVDTERDNRDTVTSQQNQGTVCHGVVTAVDAERVEAELREAFRVVKLLPDKLAGALRGGGGGWPDHLRDFADLVEPALAKTRARPALPDTKAIADADRALGWLWWIRDDRRRGIVMMRCAGARWKRIEAHTGLSRYWVWREFRKGLEVIAETLANGVRR